jgi:hypothetical protein
MIAIETLGGLAEQFIKETHIYTSFLCIRLLFLRADKIRTNNSLLE